MSYFSPLFGTLNPLPDNLPDYVIGSQIISKISSASAVSLSISTSTNITSITVTQGAWAIEGYLGLIGDATSIGPLFGVDITNQTTAGIGDLSVETSISLPIVGTSIAASNPFGIMTSKKTVTVGYGATDIWYLTANITFSGGTCGGCGWIKATRIG